MKAATGPRDRPGEARLLVIDAAGGALRDARFADLAALLDPGDLLVVNDAATLPASFPGRLRGEPVELRLAAWLDADRFEAVLFGAGDWRTRTEDRPAPPLAAAGDSIELPGFRFGIEEREGARLCRGRFDLAGDALVRALLAAGRPVQYAHLRAPLAPWDVQTLWAGRPWSMELPSASFPFTFELLAALR
ncbi:MAG TPA: S-adenosylmethionine:tRNA ribosyltransferase-isomerase, partial [Myxococcales bacterium]|nr:S-adenosylmethionine:tRNA ribosyltransferase-isomerase [Myxococcales bacterium]